MALRGMHLHAATYLLDAGANSNKANTAGDLPIHLVCRRRRLDRRVYQRLHCGKWAVEVKEKELDRSSANMVRDIISRLLTGSSSDSRLLTKNKKGDFPLMLLKESERLFYVLPQVDLRAHKEDGKKLLHAGNDFLLEKVSIF